MNMDNRSKILIAAPLVLAMVLSFIAGRISFEEELTYTEEMVLEFNRTDLEIKETRPISTRSVTGSPIDFTTGQTAPVSIPVLQTGIEKTFGGGEKVSQIDYNDKSLSLIVITGKRKIAIVKGVLVQEGDVIKGTRIDRIEPGRVLVKNKTSKWLYLERE